MKRVEISERALGDLSEIWAYIASENVEAAERYLGEIEKRFRILAESPRIGRARDDIVPGFRYFPYGSHLILYRLLPGGVAIVRVIHAARSLKDLL